MGDQRASYNQDLSFTLRIGEAGPAPTAHDVILEGGNSEQITQPIFGQKNRMPTVTVKITDKIIVNLYLSRKFRSNVIDIFVSHKNIDSDYTSIANMAGNRDYLPELSCPFSPT